MEYIPYLLCKSPDTAPTPQDETRDHGAAATADVVRRAHDRRMHELDAIQRWPKLRRALKAKVTRARRLGDGVMVEFHSMELKSMERWHAYTLESLQTIPTEILENVGVLMTDANPRVREYAMREYVPLARSME